MKQRILLGVVGLGVLGCVSSAGRGAVYVSTQGLSGSFLSTGFVYGFSGQTPRTPISGSVSPSPGQQFAGLDHVTCSYTRAAAWGDGGTFSLTNTCSGGTAGFTSADGTLTLSQTVIVGTATTLDMTVSYFSSLGSTLGVSFTQMDGTSLYSLSVSRNSLGSDSDTLTVERDLSPGSYVLTTHVKTGYNTGNTARVAVSFPASSLTVVPEPGSGLAAAGLGVGMAGRRRRRA